MQPYGRGISTRTAKSMQRTYSIQPTHDNHQQTNYWYEMIPFFSFSKRKRERETKLLWSFESFASIPLTIWSRFPKMQSFFMRFQIPKQHIFQQPSIDQRKLYGCIITLFIIESAAILLTTICAMCIPHSHRLHSVTLCRCAKAITGFIRSMS